MQDTIEVVPLRRAADKVARRSYDQLPSEGAYISNEHASAIYAEIEDIKRKLIQIDTAFLRDDLASVDYPGHRVDHLDRRKSSTIISEYKVTGTKAIIGIVTVFVFGIMTSGFITKLSELLLKGATP